MSDSQQDRRHKDDGEVEHSDHAMRVMSTIVTILEDSELSHHDQLMVLMTALGEMTYNEYQEERTGGLSAMITHGQPPFLECSSKGDRRFSAFYAFIQKQFVIPTNGIVLKNGGSIETIYQAAKIFEGGRTGLSWREAKGQKAVNQEECTKLYAQLWDRYIDQNQWLLEILIAQKGLSDKFGQIGHVCQATELWRIRKEEIERRSRETV
jgi:hypothetical protein